VLALAGALLTTHPVFAAGEERQPDVLKDLLIGRMNLPEPFHREDVLHCHVG
jgi:hypothetical protein